MGADNFLVYYGVRFQVTGHSETEQLEKRIHPLQLAAGQVGLQHYWGNFTVDGFDHYLLFVGHRFGTFGREGNTELEVSDERLATIMADTRVRLKQGGFSEAPALFFQFEADF